MGVVGNMDQKRQANIVISQREAWFQREASCFKIGHTFYATNHGVDATSPRVDNSMQHAVEAVKNAVPSRHSKAL